MTTLATLRVRQWLTESQVAHAREVGRARLAAARRLARMQPFGDPGDAQRLYVDENSAIAEQAVAIFVGERWNEELIDDLSVKPPDVGTDIDVKWTKYADGHLIVHPPDVDHWVFVLVCGEWPRMDLVGWAYGQAAKRPQYQNHPRARNPEDYWMPPDHTEDMWRLKCR